MSNYNPITDNKIYDVIIMGGGLAGQTIARQLKLSDPSLEILLLIKTEMPLAWNDFKVGESTVEISAFYFGDTLNLYDYFKNNHYKKFGFRYFIGDTSAGIQYRPEIGLSAYAPFDSFQIDRGMFENDLYNMNLLANISIISGATIKSIIISETGAPHTVSYELDNDKITTEVQAKWVVDASGRRSIIQRSLGLKEDPENVHCATWWRVKGRLDVDDLVPKEELDYYHRVAYRSRFFSTTHLMNKGYWVWLIPLASGNTSVGIVTANAIHPFDTYNTFDKSMNWLKENEPVLYHHMKNYEILDFLKMKNYSYSSKQVFSKKRWACTGEAGLFTDPYYSPGSNFIAFENSMITQMITEDFNRNENWVDLVDGYNDFIINMNKWLTKSIQSSYTYFHLDVILALSFIWDVIAGWAFICPRMFNGVFLDPSADAYLKKSSLRFFSIAYNMEAFFNDWKERTPNKFTFHFIDYLSIPFLKQIYNRNLKKGKSIQQVEEDFELNLKEIEVIVQAMFWIAVEDVYPDKIELWHEKPWINAWVITLDIDKWDQKQLFQPETTPTDVNAVYHQLRTLFHIRKDSNATTADNFEHYFG
jgi:flavin-dependent dehydrogenase